MVTSSADEGYDANALRHSLRQTNIVLVRRPDERVVAFYNRHGTADQWIMEGKTAIKWT